MSTFTVVVETASGQETRIPFPASAGVINIGRGRDCHVHVSTNGASRQHASLYFNAGQFTLTDLGTTNGTYVNGTRITPQVLLAPDDVIEVSGTFLRIEAPPSLWMYPRVPMFGDPNARKRNRKSKPPSNKSVNLSDQDGTYLAVRSVSANVQIDGPSARTKLVVTFHNDLGRTIEGDLVFPLPPMAALRELVAKIGQRTIQGKVRARERARAEYQRAIDAGKSAALGESEGEDLARLRIAPIENGEDVEISLTVDQILLPVSDGHRLIVPLTYMPRYVENASTQTEIEKAAENRPRPLTLAARASVDICIAHPDGKPSAIRCTSHRIATRGESRETRLELRDAPLDKDLQVEIADRPRADKPALWIRHDATNGPDENGPTTTVAIVPPAFADEGPTIARSVVFLVDRSGSMRGGPMDSAIRAVKGALRSLSPEDRFNIVAFDDQLEALSISPVPFDDASLSAADTFISRINARGGTESAKAIGAALDPSLPANISVAMISTAPRDQTYRLRVVVFMTDGDVTNAANVLRMAKDKLFDTRLHVLGIGDAVNHAMLSELAELGGGTYTPVTTNEDLEKALVRLKNAITAPLWTGVKVVVEHDGERKSPRMLEPPGPMDLFAAEPVLFSFRGKINAGDRLILVGQKAEGEDQRIALELKMPADARAESAATLWALLRNRRLTYRFDPADDDTLEGLGTSFGIVNRKVALVGVHADERQATIEGSVPVVLPQPANMAQSVAPPMAKPAAPGSAMRLSAPALMSPMSPAPRGAPGGFGPPPPPQAAFGGPPPAPGGFGPPPPGFGLPPPPMSPAPSGFGPPPAPAAMYGAPPPPPGAPPPGGAARSAPPLPPRAMAPRAMAAPPPPMAPMAEAKPAAVVATFTNDDAGLRALMLHQRADGLFGGDLGATLAAVAALVGRGHTAREGQFRAELRRTTQTLRSKLGSLSGNERTMALMTLALLVMPHGDPAPDGLAADVAAKFDGLSLTDLDDARRRIRSAMTGAPSGWDATPLAVAVGKTFL